MQYLTVIIQGTLITEAKAIGLKKLFFKKKPEISFYQTQGKNFKGDSGHVLYSIFDQKVLRNYLTTAEHTYKDILIPLSLILFVYICVRL